MGFFGGAILDEFHSDHTAQTSYITDHGEALLQLQEALGNDMSNLARTSRKIFFFIEVKDSQRCSAGYRVAPIRAAVRTGSRLAHDFSTSNAATDWHASADVLRI